VAAVKCGRREVICLALTFTVGPVPLRRFIPSLAALAMLSTPLLQAGAQRRPGVGMGFYTTTGLPSADVEVGPVTSTTALAEAPLVSVSLVLSAPVKKSAKRAWIAGARLTPLGVGNGDSCFVTPTVTGCQDVRFEERAALLAGGSPCPARPGPGGMLRDETRAATTSGRSEAERLGEETGQATKPEAAPAPASGWTGGGAEPKARGKPSSAAPSAAAPCPMLMLA
jgi:hypothetical protein